MNFFPRLVLLGCVILILASFALSHSAVADEGDRRPGKDTTTVPAPFDPAKVRNVRDFGARGDGLADDTEAIQAAIGPGTGITYFPSGTYVVSRELKVWSEYGRAHLVGDYSGKRPVLLLKAKTAGFGDPAKPAYVVRFYEHGPPKIKTAWCDTFGSQFEGIDITMQKDNPGSIGIFHAGAQNSFIRNCDITMDGNLAGISWLPGDSVNENIVITGGRVGIQHSEGQWPATLKGCTFKNQTVAAVDAYQCGLVFQGCLFDGCETGIRVPRGTGFPYPAARLYLEDCIFTNIRGGKTIIGSNASRFDWLLAMKNVYFKDVPSIVHWSDSSAAHIAGQPTGWCRADDISHGARWENGIKTASNGSNIRRVTANVAAPQFVPDDFVDRIPKKPECLNVKTEFGAHGNGVDDDTLHIRNAIDKAGDKPIWFPIGVYKVTDTIQLKKDTKLIGEHSTLTEIKLVPAVGDKSFDDPAHPKPLIDTVDDAAGSAVFAHFGSFLYKDDPATAATVEFNGLVGIRWRVGRNSIIDDIHSFNVAYGGERQTGFAPVVVTGKGGGCLRNLCCPWVNCSGPGQLVIEGTSEPLNLFGMSFEHCRGKPEVFIDNSKHVTFWQLQSEDGISIIDARNSENLAFKSVHYNQPDVLPLAMQFTNCTGVEIFCYWHNWNKCFSDAVHYQLNGKKTVTAESGISVYRWKSAEGL
ncbi:MAG: hypothetical protein JXM70_19180 [Pirellulales bacterium]|nr:hypothetical protein [Pirellulales bacterium]